MDHRVPLKLHTVLAFEGMPCHIEEVVGQGSNAIVYKGWYWDGLNPEQRHWVLVKELFPFHPQKKIWRSDDCSLVIEPEAADLWNAHKKSFELGNEIHLRLLADHPDMMVMGANLNSFSRNGTLYSVLGYTGGRSLQAELNKAGADLRRTARRMIGLLDALEAFHKSGYLHLDISPDNVMLVGQEDREQLFLIDYNSARRLDSENINDLRCKAGYSSPEANTGNAAAIGFPSDLYSVAAVFYRCLMGRALSLEETLRPVPPDGRDSLLLQDRPQTVRSMTAEILKRGLHTLSSRRYQTIGQMRHAFQELIDRIDGVGVTHWSLWENGRRSVEELIRSNPSLRYLKDEKKLYPFRMERECSASLEEYLRYVLSPEGRSGIILAQGGMGKTTLLLHTAMLHEKKYSPATPAVFYISLNGWDNTDTCYIRRQILMRLQYKENENHFDTAMHALHQLLKRPLRTKKGDIPAVLLLLDGLNELHGSLAPLIQEINELNAMAGVRLLVASRTEAPELPLEKVSLMALQDQDVEAALGQSGLLLPSSLEVTELLRTPLILSIYIQASDGSRQLVIQNKDQLIKAYLLSLLEKENRQLPEDSPEKWQIYVAMKYVLPAIAIKSKQNNGALTRTQLLRIVEQCWKTLDSRAFRRAFPEVIGYSTDIRAGKKNAEEWFGVMINSLLWQRLGVLIKDDNIGGYRIFHQVVAEHLAEYRLPFRKEKKWLLGLGAVVLCLVTVVCVQQYCAEQMEREQQIAAEESIRWALEVGTSGYVRYGNLYEQLRDLTDYAIQADSDSFQSNYEHVLEKLRAEEEWTASERYDAKKLEKTSGHDQLRLSWGEENAVYEYAVLSDLLSCPEDRAAYYADLLPDLKAWTGSEVLRTKVPDYADSFLSLLEADADLVAEMYHIAVAVHLPKENGQELWAEQIHKSVALIDRLDEHRSRDTLADRGQRLSTLEARYDEAEYAYRTVSSKLKRYIEDISQTTSEETIPSPTETDEQWERE